MALTEFLQSESDLGKMLMPVLSNTRLPAKLLLTPAEWIHPGFVACYQRPPDILSHGGHDLSPVTHRVG